MFPFIPPCLWGHNSPFFNYLQGFKITLLLGYLSLHVFIFWDVINWISLGSVWVDLTICEGGLAGCRNPPLLKEGDGAPKVIPPCFRLPIRHSSLKSMSTLKTMASFKIRNIGIKVHFCLPSIEGTFLPRGELRGEHVYCCIGRWWYLRGLLFDNCKRSCLGCGLSCLVHFCLLGYLPFYNQPHANGRNGCLILGLLGSGTCKDHKLCGVSSPRKTFLPNWCFHLSPLL